jgi:hypothetical protein
VHHVYICLSIYIEIYIHTATHTYIHTNLHIYIHTYIYTPTYTYILTYRYIYMYISTDILFRLNMEEFLLSKKSYDPSKMWHLSKPHFYSLKFMLVLLNPH